MKNNQNGFGLVGLLIILVVLSLATLAGWRIYTTNAQSKQRQSKASSASGSTLKVGSSDDPQQAQIRQIVNPANKQSVVLHANVYYVLTTDAGQTYYGHAQKINDEYLKLFNVTYYSVINNASTLIALGSELHGPESIMYVNMPHVTAFDQLTPASSSYTQVTDYYKAHPAPIANDAYPNPFIKNYLKSSQLQAFFFDDGTVYFAKVPDLSDNFLASASRAYTLYGSSQVSLKKVQPADIAKYTAQNIIFWENLRSDGKVSKAIADFERQQ